MAQQVTHVDMFMESLFAHHVRQQDVYEALQSGYEYAKAEERTIYVVTQGPSISFPIEFTELVNHLSSDATYFFWSPSVDTPSVLAVGCAAQITADSGDDAHSLQSAIESFEVHSVTPEGTQWYGGLAFSNTLRRHPWKNWPFGQFFLPLVKFASGFQDTADVSVTWEITGETRPDELINMYERKFKSVFRTQERHVLERNPKEPEYSLTKNDYIHAVETIVQEINMKQYDKAVFARYESIPVTSSPVSRALQHLRRDYPTAFVFAFGHEGDVFLGGTPERLVRVENRRVFVDCLAGTAPRGNTHSQDEELGLGLLQSSKNLREHRAVVDWIVQSLHGFTEDLHVREGPVLKKLANVQHLYTPVYGRLKKSTSIFDLVAQLHPTPAVAGVPREFALRAIETYEKMDRGWYAGPIGWLDQTGAGEFAVALRSGLVKEYGIAYLFAGGGIMGDSDADLEWQETNLKLIPMKSALEE